MRVSAILVGLMAIGGGALVAAQAGDNKALIHSAMSAGPASLTENATIKDNDGNVLREGANGWTCYPEAETIGPMCNDAQWDALIAAVQSRQPFEATGFGVSYMLAGEGDAIGTSNKDPYATEPTEDNDWVKEGPHMMLIVPDPAMLEKLSTDPRDPVYVMWKDTPYAHVMVRIAEK
ncbi:MAG: hypothetical protein ACE5FO_04955 [Parvularculaceae bacterium]